MHKIYLTATTILPVYNYYHYNFTNFLLLINSVPQNLLSLNNHLFLGG